MYLKLTGRRQKRERVPLIEKNRGNSGFENSRTTNPSK